MLSIIAAIGKNRELGKDNKLLWYIPEDLKRFKKLTLGRPIIMGRKTFESISRALPGRTNIIVSRSFAKSDLAKLEGVFIAESLEQAISIAKEKYSSLRGLRLLSEDEAISSKDRHASLAMTKNEGEIFIIGGGEIFKQALPIADKLYLTIVDKEFEADTFFPDYSEFKKVVFEEEGETKDYKYKFLTLER